MISKTNHWKRISLIILSMGLSSALYSFEVENYLDQVKKRSGSLKLNKAAYVESNGLSVKEISELSKKVFTKTISELKIFLDTPLFKQMSTQSCQVSKYMNHLVFDPPFNGSQWMKVLSYEAVLSPHQQFKQELCFIKDNVHRFNSSLLVIDEEDDNCRPGPEGGLNLEYVYGRGDKLLWKIYLCPQALRKIKRSTLNQALRYISLHEVFHLVGLEHYIDRPTDLMPQKLWLLHSLLYRPIKVSKTKIGRRFNKVENYRFSHIEHIGAVVADPTISFKEISPFLKDQLIINDLETGKWEDRVKSYFQGPI